MKELFKIKEEYRSLLETRMEDIKLPEGSRRYSDDYFVSEENRLNSKSIKIKESIGILAKTEAVLCNECGQVFLYYSRRDGTATALDNCQRHINRKPLK